MGVADGEGDSDGGSAAGFGAGVDEGGERFQGSPHSNLEQYLHTMQLWSGTS